tara:strand:+ start:57 stop:197 length:141 start_codon:yes stop_codon:yes gene_type:complete
MECNNKTYPSKQALNAHKKPKVTRVGRRLLNLGNSRLNSQPAIILL